MRASIGNDGWVAVDDVGLPGPLYVRVAPQPDGRLRLVELYLDASQSGSPLAGDDLRQLPIGRIEGLVNDNADAVRARLGLPAPDLSTLASYYGYTFGDLGREIESRDWVGLSFACQFDQDAYAEPLSELPSFARPSKQARAWDGVREVESDFRLTSGPADGLTDAFLNDVRRAYAAALARGERPNVSIAEQTGAPLKTVQRWVWIARQRGIMPRGRRGVPG